MDGGFVTHLFVWLIGAMALCTTVCVTGALVAMTRTGYRKD